MDVTEQLEDIDADTAKTRAGIILDGLGFDAKMQAKQVISGFFNYFKVLFRILFSFWKKVLLDPIFMILKCDLFTHFGSSFETNHDVSASQLEVLVTCPRLLVEMPKRREVSKTRSIVSKQFTLQSCHFHLFHLYPSINFILTCVCKHP